MQLCRYHIARSRVSWRDNPANRAESRYSAYLYPMALTLFAVLCAVWTLSLLLLTLGLRSIRFLRAVPPASTTDRIVSIIVAARDEADTIETALHSLLCQDYANYEVVVVNDRSADGTGGILDRIAGQHPHLRVVHVDTLPAGWLGKNHALHLAAGRAHGDYLLFTDADVVMSPSTLARAVAYAESNGLDHIAVFPEIPAPNYWTAAAFSLFGLGFLMLTQPWFARTGRSPMPVGIGAFNFVRATTYREIGGHTHIALRPDDDIAIANKLHKARARQDVLMGQGLISVMWYTSLGGFIRGIEKNSFAPFGYSLPKFAAAMILHFVAYVGPWLGLFLGGPITILCAVTIILQMLTLSATHAVAEEPWRYAPVMLFSSLIFEYAVIRAVWLTLRQGGIRWRDTFYPLALLRGNTL